MSRHGTYVKDVYRSASSTVQYACVCEDCLTTSRCMWSRFKCDLKWLSTVRHSRFRVRRVKNVLLAVTCWAHRQRYPCSSTDVHVSPVVARNTMARTQTAGANT
ncbi:hypothetical protein LSAT2_027347, partial [Lamellibrachia satsuma]